jgi:hypothetical protein
MLAPPGTQIKSNCGQSANVVVGTICMPPSAVTGSRHFHTRWTFASGSFVKTS